MQRASLPHSGRALRAALASLRAAPRVLDRRTERQLLIVERYDLCGEPRDVVARSVALSRRRFYEERRSGLARLSDEVARSRVPDASVEARDAYVAAHLRNVDLLYQAGALGPAADKLGTLAAQLPRTGDKVEALSRLVEVSCDLGRIAEAEAALHDARALAGGDASHRTQNELLAADARVRFARRESVPFETAFETLRRHLERSTSDERAWTLLTRVASYASVFRYFVHDIAGAVAAGRLAGDAIARATDVPPFVRTHLLMTLGCVHWNDPVLAGGATAKNLDAFAIALDHGMVATACQALYNVLHYALYCDEPVVADEVAFARDLLDSEELRPLVYADPALRAVATATCGRFADALTAIDGALRACPPWTFDLSPGLTTVRARILFKAGRLREAERVAGDAVERWHRSQLLGEGTALRIRAEALEALGDRRAARRVIEEAVPALESFTPVHHLFGAYACAYRLTSKPTYRERLGALRERVHRTQAEASVGRATRTVRARACMTAREREVATLVADGWTNPAIARELGISRKTVANHVASIFQQTGVRARWQITRAHVGRGL